MRPLDATTGRAHRRRAAGALLLLAATACGDGALGGPGLQGGALSLRVQPRLHLEEATPAPSISYVRLAITRLPDRARVLDTLVGFDGATGAALDLGVPMATMQDRFELRLAAADAGGDTIFRAIDTATVARIGESAVLELLLRYAGRDTVFQRIAAGPSDTVVSAGVELPMWAVGYRDGSSRPEPLASVAWSSSDAGIVRVSPTGGLATVVASGGEAWLYARTATGLVDSARVAVRAPLARLDLSSAAETVLVGGTATLTAIGRDAAGGVVTGQPVTWSSANPAVAVVSTTGVVTGVAPGTATITASSGALRASGTVTVLPAPVASVAVSPAALALTVGQRAELAASAATATGALVANPGVAWTTGNPAVATVAPSGEVTATGVGGTTIVATIGGVADTALVTVAARPADAVVVSPAAASLPYGGTLLLTAAVTDSAGQPVPNFTATWASADPSVATVSPAGLVTARSAGTTVIAATVNGKVGSVAVTVLPPPVASLDPLAPVTLVVGDRQQLTATPRDASGNVLTGRTVTWSSSTPGVALVSGTGTVTAVAMGSATITAASEGAIATATVTVTLVPVVSVSVAPVSVTLAVGATQQLTATALDLGGGVLTGRAVTWRSSDAAVASVATDGLVTARGAGTATVSATIGGVTQAATIVVPTPQTYSVRLTPGSVTLHDGETVRLSPQAYLGLDPVSATFTWTSRSPATAAVAGGLVTGGATAGSTWIVATDLTGARDSTLVTVVVRRPLTFDVAATTLGLGQRWGTGVGTRQLCRDAADATALVVGLASTDAGRVQPQSSVTIPAGARCAPFDASAIGTTGSAGIVALAPTVNGVEWTPDTLAVTVGSPRLRLTVAATLTTGTANIPATVTALDQAGLTRLVIGDLPLRLTSSDGNAASWRSGTATIPDGESAAAVMLDTDDEGTVMLSAADARPSGAIYAPGSASVTVAFAVGALEVVGWPADGRFVKKQEYRVRIYPTNADGTRRTSFGQSVGLMFDQDGRLEVHKDKYPLLEPGATVGSKDGRVDDGKTLSASPGDAYLSVIVVMPDADRIGGLVISDVTGSYATLARLAGQTPP
jgi:uncharacterized protein YjdB